MGKVLTITVILIGYLMMLLLLGFIDLKDSTLLTSIGSGEQNGFDLKGFFGALFDPLNLVMAATGAVVGFFVTSSRDSATMAAVASGLGTLVLKDLWAVFNKTSVYFAEYSWISNIMWYITVLLAVILAISIIDWWRGTDN